MRRFVLSLMLIAAAVLAAPSAGYAKSRWIYANSEVVTAMGGWKVQRHPTLGSAERSLGRPSAVYPAKYGSCFARWHHLGLLIRFDNYGGGGSACQPAFGRAQAAKIKGAGSGTWRTRRGLRIGQTGKRLQRLYPYASRHRATWWLVEGVSPFGGCSGGCPYGVVSAVVLHHRVRALKLWIGSAGE